MAEFSCCVSPKTPELKLLSMYNKASDMENFTLGRDPEFGQERESVRSYCRQGGSITSLYLLIEVGLLDQST